MACTSVASIIKTSCSPNPAGNSLTILVVAIDDVLTLPDPAPGLEHVISAAIALKVGKSAARWEGIQYTTEQMAEPEGAENESDSFKFTVNHTLRGSNPIQDRILSNAMGGQFMLLVTDNLGQTKVYGTKAKPMKIAIKYASGKKTGDLNGAELSFSSEGNPHLPPHYTGTLIPVLA